MPGFYAATGKTRFALTTPCARKGTQGVVNFRSVWWWDNRRQNRVGQHDLERRLTIRRANWRGHSQPQGWQCQRSQQGIYSDLPFEHDSVPVGARGSGRLPPDNLRLARSYRVDSCYQAPCSEVVLSFGMALRQKSDTFRTMRRAR